MRTEGYIGGECSRLKEEPFQGPEEPGAFKEQRGGPLGVDKGREEEVVEDAGGANGV